MSYRDKLLAAIHSSDMEYHLEDEQKRMIEVSREFAEQKKQQKLSKSAYNTRRGEQKQKLTGIKRDYCEKVLGEYRFGLHQKAPLSNDPDAPAAYRFSQLAEYRFAENNKRFM